jgi:hypothetical protein
VTGKEHFQAIVKRQASHCGFWHGAPNPASIEKLYAYFGVKEDFELGLKLGADCRWVTPEKFHAWTNPDYPMKIDAFFFGNDFGSQLDLLISPEHFDRFVMPYFRELTDQAHSHGYNVVLHSCGSIDRVIPRLIDAGVEVLHPIQAMAKNMDAASLAKKYNGKIVFLGGVDTQRLLPFGTPQEVRDEVRRLKDLFGPNFLVSPSHESLLPNVSPENIMAMAEAAAE